MTLVVAAVASATVVPAPTSVECVESGDTRACVGLDSGAPFSSVDAYTGDVRLAGSQTFGWLGVDAGTQEQAATGGTWTGVGVCYQHSVFEPGWTLVSSCTGASSSTDPHHYGVETRRVGAYASPFVGVSPVGSAGVDAGVARTTTAGVCRDTAGVGVEVGVRDQWHGEHVDYSTRCIVPS